MRRKDKEIIDREIIEDILRSNFICRIALAYNNLPYVIPMDYGFYENKIYLHTAGVGKKIDYIKKNNHVCFEITDSIKLIKKKVACRFDVSFRSVIGYGKIFIVNNRQEKIDGLKIIMHQHTGRWDWDFDEKDLSRVTILRVDIETLSAKQAHI